MSNRIRRSNLSTRENVCIFLQLIIISHTAAFKSPTQKRKVVSHFTIFILGVIYRFISSDALSYIYILLLVRYSFEPRGPPQAKWLFIHSWVYVLHTYIHTYMSVLNIDTKSNVSVSPLTCGIKASQYTGTGSVCKFWQCGVALNQSWPPCTHRKWHPEQVTDCFN